MKGNVSVERLLLFFLGSIMLFCWFVFRTESFSYVTKYAWWTAYPMGYMKLFFLGTTGELIKYRVTRGDWNMDKLFQRALLWGCFGMWFTYAFPLFSGGVEFVIGKGLLPNFAVALQKSFAINVGGGYALFMMHTHEYGNYVIENDGRRWSLKGFCEHLQPGFMFGFLVKTIPVWIGLHWYTFSQDPGEQVMIAGVLALLLGFLLSVGKKRRASA